MSYHFEHVSTMLLSGRNSVKLEVATFYNNIYPFWYTKRAGL